MNENDLKALCAEAGVSFYDSELVRENSRLIYRVYIIKKGGVSLEDCQKLSEILSPLLDVNEPSKEAYFFEVSSPGLERKLSKLEHFALSLGELVQITTNEKEKLKGKLLSADGENLTLQDLDDEKSHFTLNFKDIKKAKTFVLW